MSKIELLLPSLEQMEAQVARVRERVRVERALNATFLQAQDIASLGIADRAGSAETPNGQASGGRFNMLSLECWLAVAALAGVAHVPGRRVGFIHGEDAMRALDGVEPSSEESAAAMRAMTDELERLGHDEMIRWDHCAGEEVKYLMSMGSVGLDPATRPRGYFTSLKSGKRLLPIDDSRVMDLMLSYGAEWIPIIARPWVLARMVAGTEHGAGITAADFPLEFRVYVENGAVAGVANYYPQADLPDDPEILALAQQAADQARVIVAAMARRGLRPANASLDADPTAIACTMDFLVRAGDNALLFLEAGPPFNLGAHPCCFNQEGQEEIRIDGIALSSRRAPVPFLAQR